MTKQLKSIKLTKVRNKNAYKVTGKFIRPHFITAKSRSEALKRIQRKK